MFLWKRSLIQHFTIVSSVSFDFQFWTLSNKAKYALNDFLSIFTHHSTLIETIHVKLLRNINASLGKYLIDVYWVIPLIIHWITIFQQHKNVNIAKFVLASCVCEKLAPAQLLPKFFWQHEKFGKWRSTNLLIIKKFNDMFEGSFTVCHFA